MHRSGACLFGIAFALAASAAEQFGPETSREFAIDRKEVFAFTRTPAVKRNGDRVEISFAAKAACDVAIAIEDAQGKIIRHLAAGVLGPRAPEPLQKGSLTQTVVWNGKDDFGTYVDDKDACVVRVSLGLKARFEKNLYSHPHRSLGRDTAIAADPSGVYVYQNNYLDYIRMYDHDCRYVRTVYPFPANKIRAIKGLRMRALPPDGRMVPDKARGSGEGRSSATLLPCKPSLYKGGNYLMGGMVAHKGKLFLAGERLVRLGIDGSSAGMDYLGPDARIDMGKHGRRLPYCMAVSPDARWIYMTRANWADGWAPYRYWPQAVYRLGVNGERPPTLFFGTVGAGSGNDALDGPMSVAVDAKGRVYVADWENDRVQVVSPEGKYLRTIGKVVGPVQVEVNPDSGELYVFCWQTRRRDTYGRNKAAARKYNARVRRSVRKYAPIDSAPAGQPKLLMDAPLQGLRSIRDRVTVDFWSKPTRYWVVRESVKWGSHGRQENQSLVYVLEERDGRVDVARDFVKEVEKDGVRQHVAWFQRQFLYFDPVREVLYVAEMDCAEMKNFNRLVAIDVNTGKTRHIKLPKAAADAAIDAHGFVHLRIKNTVVRFDPRTWKEIPYDYGEERDRFTSVIVTPGGGGSSEKYGPMGVAPTGEVIVSCVYGYSPQRASGRKTTKAPGGVLKWTPRLYAGRPGSLFVHVFDRHGQLRHEDVLSGGGLFTGGLDLDFQGNMYASVRKARILDGEPWGNNGSGAVMKFGPKKGRFLTDGKAMVELTVALDRPKPVQGLWAEGSLWTIGDVSCGSTNHCWCRQGKFKVDYYGRVFLPQSDQYCIAVADTSGQLITRVGQYGNADSAGPDSLVPLGGDEVGLFDAHYVTVHTDRRLFISDVGNGRIFSATLGYHATERVELKGVPDAAR